MKQILQSFLGLLIWLSIPLIIVAGDNVLQRFNLTHTAQVGILFFSLMMLFVYFVIGGFMLLNLLKIKP